MGGANENPEIIPEAMELYIRLVLLAEFYRGVFAFDTKTADPNVDNKRITIVPEFDGIWEKFIELIFDDAKYVNEGAYSEQQVKKMIK